MNAWRRLEVLALLGTIPAFYMALLATDRVASVALYLAAAVASLLVIRHETRATRPASAAASPRHRLGWWLGAALLASALLPAGDALPLLAVRLAAAALVVLRLGESIRPWFWRGGLPYLLALALAVLGLCGLGFWWLEPRALSYGDGLWLAFTTAATVGYGDIVPSTPASKIFAVFVVLLGFAVLSLVTAAIAAMWVQTEERRIEHEILREVHAELRVVRDELATLRREIAAQAEPPAPKRSG